jgi:small subunit ribosomal protein S21|tara:strand:+ start:1552 stop:1800 length:249 start_codon:yes stop_codon:yes gene_type:complete
VRNYKNDKQDKPIGGMTVIVRNDDVNKAMRIFKKKVAEAGIIQEVRERQAYVKPSEKRAKAKAAGRARWLKKQQKDIIDKGY